MIEPTPANESPSRPTSRRSPRSSATTWVGLPAAGPLAVAAAPARPWFLRFRPRVSPSRSRQFPSRLRAGPQLPDCQQDGDGPVGLRTRDPPLPGQATYDDDHVDPSQVTADGRRLDAGTGPASGPAAPPAPLAAGDSAGERPEHARRRLALVSPSLLDYRPEDSAWNPVVCGAIMTCSQPSVRQVRGRRASSAGSAR